MPFGYLIKILYAKNLTPEEFGLIFSVIGFFGLASLVCNFGMLESLNYFGVKFYEKKKLLELKLSFYYVLITQTLLVIFSSIIIFLLSDFLLEKYFKVEQTNILIFFLLYFIFSNLANSIFIIFNIYKKYFHRNVFGFFHLFLTFVFSYFLLFFEGNFIYLSLAWGIPYTILILIYYLIFRKNFQELKKIKLKFNFKLYKKILKYSSQAFLGVVAIILLGKIDIVFITYFLGVIEVGFYEIAFSLANILLFIMGPILAITLSVSKSLIEKNQKKKLNKHISQIYKIFLVFGIPLVVLFTQFPKEIILFLFGENYIQAKNLLLVLSIGSFFSLFFSLNSAILGALGKLKQRNYIIFFAGILNIFLNYFLIKFFGVLGVAFATTLIIFFVFFSTFILIRKYKIKILISFSNFIKIIFCGISFFILVLTLKKNLSFNFGVSVFGFEIGTLLEIFLVCGISILFYLVLLFFLKVFDNEKIKKYFEF